MVALFCDEPAPALTLIGALVLEIIGAATAETRQLRQIEAEAERQGRPPAAERERNLAMLAHVCAEFGYRAVPLLSRGSFRDPAVGDSQRLWAARPEPL